MSTPKNVEAQLCDCCALWLANNDDSACRDYHNHTHPQARMGTDFAGVDIDAGPVSRPDSWTCDGCDTTQLPLAEAWSYYVL